MAHDVPTEGNGNGNTNQDAKELKYLDFVKAAVLYVVVCIARLYEWAREKCGPLKPGVRAVEGSVKFVIGPIYHKFHGAPFNLLRFLDDKVDESMKRIDQAMKKVTSQAERTPAAAKELYARCKPTAKELYAKYEPVAIQYAVLAWHVVQWIPVARQVIRVALPILKYGLKTYNWSIRKARRKGYAAARYMPLVPMERITKLFNAKS